jgi:hypothetical protein
MLLWFCEYVIRACTKKWIDKHDNKTYQENYTQLCEYYTEENMATIDLLHVMFMKGWNFTSTSIAIYRDKSAMAPALNASQEYLNYNSCDEHRENIEDPTKTKKTKSGPKVMQDCRSVPRIYATVISILQ